MNTVSTINSNIEEAIELTDLGFAHDYEDLIRLTELCESIELDYQNGIEPNENLAETFRKRILVFYDKRGLFRSMLETTPVAKKLLLRYNR